MNSKDKKELENKLLALFILSMKYNKKLNPVMVKYKIYKNELMNELNAIYKKYTKNGKLVINQREIKKEQKLLEPLINKITNGISDKELIILPIILNLVHNTVYSKTYNILFKGKNLTNMSQEEINKIIIQYKINGKTNLQRIKDNSTIFNKKINKDIEKSLKESKTIQDLKKNIESRFESEEKISKRLINNEIARVFGDTTMAIYIENNVKHVEWVAQLEQNSCSECGSLDGEIFLLEDAPIPISDTHNNCHCILVPID
ncbi:MAG TPA: minor capsid protein [Clostridium sp.]